MINLYKHKRTVNSIFELLGNKENDITSSLGWALANSPGFLNSFLNNLFPNLDKPEVEKITLQEHKSKGGITDIELVGSKIHVVIEAKRGWTLPGLEQLQLYAKRLTASKALPRAMVAMSECSPEYVTQKKFPSEVGSFPVKHYSWKEIHALAKITDGTHAEKRLLAELRTYLQGIVKMQNQESNMVYVVSLAAGTPDWCRIAWRDIVTRKGLYFHPVGNHYPKEPVNYIGFRYDGRLQSIHHVDSCDIVPDMHDRIPEIDPGSIKEHYLYTLGAAIIPQKEIRSGRVIRSNRVWAMIDLLLTCDTISEASDLTKERLEGE